MDFFSRRVFGINTEKEMRSVGVELLGIRMERCKVSVGTDIHKKNM